MSNSKLRSYVDAMRQASAHFTSENPDYIVAPMVGSVPFIDVMAIVDRDFDPTKVVYMPASSRINDVNKIIRSWYESFLKDVVELPHRFPKVMGIDEVVSGCSIVRCVKSIDEAMNTFKRNIRQGLVERAHNRRNQGVALEALREADQLTDSLYASEIAQAMSKVSNGLYDGRPELVRADSQVFIDAVNEVLNKKINYSSIGIEDSKVDDSERVVEYRRIKSQGRVRPVPVETIISMDRPEFCYPVFETTLTGNARKSYPKTGARVVSFHVEPQYLAFLEAIADYVGADKSRLGPANLTRILETANKYLPAPESLNE